MMKRIPFFHWLSMKIKALCHSLSKREENHWQIWFRQHDNFMG